MFVSSIARTVELETNDGILIKDVEIRKLAIRKAIRRRKFLSSDV